MSSVFWKSSAVLADIFNKNTTLSLTLLLLGVL